MLTFTTSEIPHSPTPRMHPAVILACEQWRCPADIEYQPLTCAATIYCHDVTSHREACRRIQPPVPPASCARGRCRALDTGRAGRPVDCTVHGGRPAVLGRGERHPRPLELGQYRNIRRVIPDISRNHHADGAIRSRPAHTAEGYRRATTSTSAE